MKLFQGETAFDFTGRMGLFGIASGLAIVVSLLAIATMGLNFGIDFVGGYEIQVKFEDTVSETRIREVLAPLGLGDVRVQRFGAVEENEYLVMVREHGTLGDAQRAQLTERFGALSGGADKLTEMAVAESGERITVGFSSPVREAQLREILEDVGVKVREITGGEREDQPAFVITLVSLADRIERSLRDGLSIADDAPLVGRVEFVGPQVGAQLRNQGILAIVYALGFILLYIAVRFDLFFSPGAVVALIHDVIITTGVFAIFQIEFNLPIIAAILALVGYSLNDTIVVYDRIRENTVRYRGRALRAMVNTSINQTLSRTLLTSGTTLLVVIALLVFGGGIIRNFSIALLVGVVVGTYSSVAIASPVYILLRERAERKAGDGKGRSAPMVAA